MEEKTTKWSRRLPRIRFLLLISKFEQLNLFCLGGAIVAQSWTFFRCQCVDLIGNHCQNDDDHMIIIHMIVTLLGWKLYTGWGFISREGSSERSSLFRYTKSEWCWIPFDVVEFWIGFQYSNMFVDFQYMNMFVDDFDFMILMMNDVIITSCHWWWCLACPNQLKQTNKQTDKQWSTVLLTYLLRDDRPTYKNFVAKFV